MVENQPDPLGYCFVANKDQAGSSFNSRKHLERAYFDKQLNKVLIKASQKLGKNIRTHSFRTSFITDLLNSGVELSKIKDIIGHKDIKTTNKYIRCDLREDDLMKILQNLESERNKDIDFDDTDDDNDDSEKD
uniref:Putative phage integrase n=1 Tax=Netrium digitus TaxID=43946 RepID=A0A191T580_9VIRI|nr:putative phage integrase [Netrium digitus]ANI25550.1 putative phage integrase [Netrium digitus]